MIRGLKNLSCEDRLRAGVVQPGEGSGETLQSKEGRLGRKRKIRKILRVVKHWHKLPRTFVAVPSMEVSKARLDGALSNLV